MTSVLFTPARGLLAALAGVALIAAPAALAAPTSHAKLYTVTIQQLAFGPVPTGLRVGDTIDWVNDDIFLHSATASDRSFDVELKPKTHALTVLREPGVIPFNCRYHPGMKGRLVVSK